MTGVIESSAPTGSEGYGRAQLRLFREGDDTVRFPTTALARLVDIHRSAAERRDAQIVLLWPATLRVLPLAHVFATAEEWMQGNKHGLRTLFYPAKANTLYPLNHLHVGRREIRTIGQTFAEIGTTNPLVTRSLRHKDTLLIKAGSMRELRPCINELFPRFEQLSMQDKWTSCEDELLEHILTKLRRRAERAALKGSFTTLGAPASAPDALFTIGYQLNKRELREAVQSLFALGAPDVVLVDATRYVRTTVDRWTKHLEDFHLALNDVMGANRPGIVIVTDDGGVAWQLSDRLTKCLNKKQKSSARLRISPIVCCATGDGLHRPGGADVIGPAPRRFEVHVHDKDASKLIAHIYRTVHKLNLDPDVTSPLRDAASFLNKLSALPSSQDVVNAWLDERQANIQFREQFNWLSYKAKALDFLTAGRATTHRGDLEKTLAAIDKVVRNYQGGTTLALAMAEAAATATRDNRIAIVLTGPVLRMLAERFLERFSFATAPFAELRPHLDFVLTTELARHLTEQRASQYVFVGVDEHALLLLTTDDRIPDGSQVLLTYRTGLYMRWTLKPIAAFGEFAIFRPRIQMLLTQLDRQITFDPHSVLQRDDFVLPSFNFRASSGDAGQAEPADGQLARIDLRDRAPLIRGERALLYVYDPAHEDAGPGGFRAVKASELSPGDLLFELSEDLRQLLEDVLERAGVSLARDRPFEQMLRQYHRLVVRRVAERFPQPTRAAQVVAIRARIKELYPDLMGLSDNIGHWVDVGSSSETPFDQLRPQAPHTFAHFRAFAEALGFDPIEVTQFWQFAIYPIRIQRRLDGRYVGDVYANLLFDPESAIVHAKLSRSDTDVLYQLARENVAMVLQVQYPALANRSHS